MAELMVDINGRPCLTPEQNLRLDCLMVAAELCAPATAVITVRAETVIDIAENFFNYVKDGNNAES